MNAYKVVQLVIEGVVALGVIGSGLVASWKFVAFLIGMNANLQLIMTNHLPHIYDELKGMREDFKLFLKERGDNGQSSTSNR